MNKTKEQIAKDLGISRKTLYNYLNELNISDLSIQKNFDKLKEYSNSKNKSKEISKSQMLQEIENLKKQNIELRKQNENLEKNQDALIQQIDYFKNSIDNEIHYIKENITLLLEPPKETKKSFFQKLFKL